jgi:RNA polymerase sigma-70 factor (ECF subfamily)
MTDWQQVYDQHAQAVWKTTYRLLRDPDDAADAVQEAFVSAMEYAASHQIRNWAGLLKRMATARALDRLRRKIHLRRSRDCQARVESLWDPASLEASGPEVDPDELSKALAKALAKLPAAQAEAFCLKCIEEMSYAQIADQTGHSVGHVGVLLHRARGALRDLLACEPCLAQDR